MAESALGEKTEAPTPRRRQEARREGNVARSTDLTAACILLASVMLLYWFGEKLMTSLKLTMEMMLSAGMAANPTRADDIAALPSFAGRLIVTAVAPLMLGAMAVGLLITVMQVGLVVSAAPLQPKLSKLSPLRGVKNLFSRQAAVRLLMIVGNIVLISTIAAVLIAFEIDSLLKLAQLEVLAAFSLVGGIVFRLALRLALVLIVLAIIDYAFQRMNHEHEMKMTKQELKEELKRMDGDPLVKQRRSRVARQLAMQRMAQAVPGADVVVTNPTHYSVALKYDPQTMSAPKVVAKGADFMAMRIRQIAVSHGIPLIERKELARGLYATVEVGQQVPPEHYNAVAEILAYVYRISNRQTA